MAKRPKVPTALHSELTEYSSLLRALRTSHTLDLVQHLAEPPPHALRPPSDLDDVQLSDEEHEEPVQEPPSESVPPDHTSAASSPARSRVSESPERHRSGKGKQRDTWTRWPLLAGDVHVPEWGLHEEVRLVAKHVLSSSASRSSSVLGHYQSGKVSPGNTSGPANTQPSLSDEDDADHPALSSVALEALTSDSAVFLNRILALLTTNVPNVDQSMQNRIRPINWETVVDVACANGVVNADVAEHIRNRMSQLYPLVSLEVIAHRVAQVSAKRAQLQGVLNEYDASLLATPGPAESLMALHKKAKPTHTKRSASKEGAPPPKRKRSEEV
ncbi:hypothetical protein C8Q70DRAFT_1001590 [Cubamyces menziesii]|nr:hypothetical protein C8Q70DRAFT_1001590 [Cubamyces menziesii]